MNDLIPFEFEGKPVRVVRFSDGDALFVARDAAEALGYVDTKRPIQLHCKHAQTLEEALKSKGGQIVPPAGGWDLQPNTTLITEGDVIRLIIRSKLPAADAFERKVCDEILPSIRKTGVYVAPGTVPPGIEAMDARTLFEAACKRLLDENDKLADAATNERKKTLLLTNEKLENTDQIQQYKTLVENLLAQLKRDADAKYGMWNNVKKQIGNISQRKLFDDPKITHLPSKKKDGTDDETAGDE